MNIFRRKKPTPPSPYPLEQFEPVLRSSICTREMTSCFRDRETGNLKEIMMIEKFGSRLRITI